MQESFLKQILSKYNISEYNVLKYSSLQQNGAKSAARIPQNAHSAVVVLLPYMHQAAFGGNISAYAAVADYHTVAAQMLGDVCGELRAQHAGHAFEMFVDASPFNEVEAAWRGALGVFGRNSLLINARYGSYVFIAIIVTTADLTGEATAPEQQGEMALGCRGCNMCTVRCPGAAIDMGHVEPGRCASFLTQKKGELTQEESAIVKKAGYVFGCDICQKVCPHNLRAQKGLDVFADIEKNVTKASLDPLNKSRAYAYRGAEVLKRNIDIIEA